MKATAPSSPAKVDQVLGLIREHAAPLETCRVPLADAAGRVLRETIFAPEDQPAFDRSAMDGYAVRLDDPSTQYKVVDQIRAGDWKSRQLQPGQAVQIATGAALPAGNLQVIIKEDVRVDREHILVLHRDSKRNIRFRGEDARPGTELVEAGARLRTGTLALLASLGCTQPLVTRPIHVLHLTTGNEIVPPERQPAPGQIRDSNTTLVHAFLAEFGISAEHHHLSEDECAPRGSAGFQPAVSQISNLRSSQIPLGVGGASALTSRFRIDVPDLLLISGGASVGEHDFTRPLLQHLGYTIHVHRTTTRPGKPLIFASRGQALAFGLPGNPLAHFVCLNLYVRAALLGLSGSAQGVEFISGALACDFPADENERETLWPARLSFSNSQLELTPLPWRSSGDITSLARANALVRIPPGAGQMRRGTLVQFIPTSNIE